MSPGPPTKRNGAIGHRIWLERERFMRLRFRIIQGLTLFATMVITFLVISPGSCLAQQEEPAGPHEWIPDSQVTMDLARTYGFRTLMVVAIGNFLKTVDDTSVCLYLAKEKGYDPRPVAAIRENKTPWKAVMKNLSYSPFGLFENLAFSGTGPIPDRFKHAYEEYKKWRDDPTREMDLTDDDVRDMVQLRLIVKLYGVPASEVMKLRNSGVGWEEIMIRGGK
jgi:hypothetical protein